MDSVHGQSLSLFPSPPPPFFFTLLLSLPSSPWLRLHSLVQSVNVTSLLSLFHFSLLAVISLPLPPHCLLFCLFYVRLSVVSCVSLAFTQPLLLLLWSVSSLALRRNINIRCANYSTVACCGSISLPSLTICYMLLIEDWASTEVSIVVQSHTASIGEKAFLKTSSTSHSLHCCAGSK